MVRLAGRRRRRRVNCRTVSAPESYIVWARQHDEDMKERGGVHTSTSTTSRSCKNRLDHGGNGCHTPLYISELGLDRLLLAHDGLKLLVGLLGLELTDLVLILLRLETVAFADSTLGLAV